MTEIEIMQFIIDHPNMGRVRIAKACGISESAAREIMRAVKLASETGKITVKQHDTLQEKLDELGITRKQFSELFEVRNYPITKIETGKTRRFRIGIIADTHLSDKACAVAELADFYDRCDQADVSAVVHAGDLVAGQNVYKGQLVDLAHIGYMNQLRNVILNYPRLKNGAKTYVIAGNHDLSFKQNDGSEIVLDACDQRDDLIYCGAYDGHIQIDGIKIGLHHGAGGCAYSASYKLQKYIEKIGAGQKPQIYVLGHYHSSLYMFYRNIHAFMPDCFQKPNDFSVRLGLANSLGGWICEIEAEESDRNTIKSIKLDHVVYYS